MAKCRKIRRRTGKGMTFGLKALWTMCYIFVYLFVRCFSINHKAEHEAVHLVGFQKLLIELQLFESRSQKGNAPIHNLKGISKYSLRAYFVQGALGAAKID